MIVMKFGGTSVGSAERMIEVVEILRSASREGGAPVVVLSAMSAVTNALIDGAERAVGRDTDGAFARIDEIRQRHAQCIDALFESAAPKAELLAYLQARMDELAILYKGVSYLGELTRRSLDTVSGMGELLSSRIVCELANSRGLPARFFDARQFMITDDDFGKAAPLWKEVTELARASLLPASKEGLLCVTQGFIGATASGANTTLGRGGSDFSASIIGVALDADEIQIWTDVDGMMTADPRIISSARVLPEVSFQEASELAYFGAKVLHPLTIKPAVEKSIPVRILNTMRPDRPGTLIQASVESEQVVRAVASKKGITAVFISSPKMLMSHGFLARVFAVFDKHRTAIDLISTSEISVALTIDNSEKLEQIREDLGEYGEVRVMGGLAIVTVVGAQFRELSGISGRVFSALTNINILMISGGASDINLSFVVAGDDADAAVRNLHAEFFPSG